MTTQTGMGVRTLHPEYIANAPRWKLVRSVLASDCKSYLRNVGASETDPVFAAQRQSDYSDGAILYNFTKRTLSGMVGAVMRKHPEIMLTSKTEYLLDNCDGSGTSLEMQAQYVLMEVDAIGKVGLLEDAPQTSAASKADQNAGKLNPRILVYTAENIINWRYETFGSTRELSMVVLREQYQYQESGNEFEWKSAYQYRVLEIIEGAYRQRLIKHNDGGSQIGEEEVFEPTMNGKRMTKIPFQLIESDDGLPPLEALATINVGHYRNSADVEQSAFICGQPTLMVYPGKMTTKQFNEANPHGIRLGSVMGHNLGEGGGAELLQAQESNLSLKLMEQKEEQAVKAGAQLITPSAQITAESARLQRGADTSIMATIAMNVSKGYEKAIGICAEMVNDSGDIVFELNMEFFLAQMTAQDRAAWMMDINAGLMPVRAMYAAYRSAGITNWTDEEIEEGLIKQPPQPAPKLNVNVSGEIPQSPN